MQSSKLGLRKFGISFHKYSICVLSRREFISPRKHQTHENVKTSLILNQALKYIGVWQVQIKPTECMRMFRLPFFFLCSGIDLALNLVFLS